MTRTRRWFAPGKMMWIGEYAVLDGAPAVVAAVDRGVHVVRAGDADRCVVRTSLSDREVVATSAGVPDAGDADRLVDAVATTLGRAGIALPPGRWTIDSSDLSRDTKLGLGSSGAVAAGLVAAWAGDLDAGRALELALEAHHRFQGRVGSGSDVIASAMGGLVRVQQGRRPEPSALPAGLDHATIATGQPADTRAMVRAMRAWREREPSTAAPLFAALAGAAADGADAVARGDADAWIDAVERFAATERALTVASGVAIVAPVVERAMHAARAAGWTAKPSGAGGGDVVVAFARGGDRGRLDAEVRAAGLTSISLALAPRGVLFAPRTGPVAPEP